MTFREHVRLLVESVPGATAATVMGRDGIPIDTYDTGELPVDLATLLVEYSAVMKPIWGGAAAGGVLQELTVAAADVIAVLRPLTSEYYLAVLLRPDGLVGKARYLMRMATPDLVKELS